MVALTMPHSKLILVEISVISSNGGISPVSCYRSIANRSTASHIIFVLCCPCHQRVEQSASRQCGFFLLCVIKTNSWIHESFDCGSVAVVWSAAVVAWGKVTAWNCQHWRSIEICRVTPASTAVVSDYLLSLAVLIWYSRSEWIEKLAGSATA